VRVLAVAEGTSHCSTLGAPYQSSLSSYYVPLPYNVATLNYSNAFFSLPL